MTQSTRPAASTVLLVDDNLHTLESTGAYLRARGLRVIALSSPFGATNVVRRDRPDAIVLDVMMPGLSGEGLGGIIRKDFAIPIVYFSSMPEEDLRDMASRTPRTTYVLKSEGVPFLADEIERLLERRL